MLLVDRPSPVKYETHGVSFTIAFRWGEANDDCPHEVVVLYDEAKTVAGTKKGPWDTLGQAEAAGKDIADEFVAKHRVNSESN